MQKKIILSLLFLISSNFHAIASSKISNQIDSLTKKCHIAVGKEHYKTALEYVESAKKLIKSNYVQGSVENMKFNTSLTSKISYCEGQVYYKQGKHYEAKKAYSRVRENVTKWVIGSNVNIGMNLIKLGHSPREVIKSYIKKEIDLHPNQPNGYYTRGLLYSGQNGEYQDNTGKYLNSSDLREYDLALNDFTKAIKLNYKLDYSYYYRGYVYLKEKKYSNAISDFSNSIKYNPKLKMAYRQRSKAYEMIGNKKSALKDLIQACNSGDKKACSMSKSRITNYEKEAQKYFDNQNYSKSIDVVTELLDFYPQKYSYLLFRGESYQKINDLEAAIRDYKLAISLSPQNLKAYTFLKNVYLEKNEYKLALELYNELLKVSEKNGEAYFQRGLIYQLLEKPELAVSDFEKGCKLKNHDSCYEIKKKDIPDNYETFTFDHPRSQTYFSISIPHSLKLVPGRQGYFPETLYIFHNLETMNSVTVELLSVNSAIKSIKEFKSYGLEFQEVEISGRTWMNVNYQEKISNGDTVNFYRYYLQSGNKVAVVWYASRLEFSKVKSTINNIISSVKFK